jgi:hypothetical protein
MPSDAKRDRRQIQKPKNGLGGASNIKKRANTPRQLREDGPKEMGLALQISDLGWPRLIEKVGYSGVLQTVGQRKLKKVARQEANVA